MQLYHQTDENGIYLHTQERRVKPDRAVSAPLPEEIPDGQLLRWETQLCHSLDMLTWGEEGTGQWVIEADHRNDHLYLTDDGAEYTIGSENEHGRYAGNGPLPAWLTDASRPSELHVWVGDQWYVDPQALEQAQSEARLAQAQERVAREIARATSIVDVIAPAVAGGYAQSGDAEVLAAWQQYRYLVSKVATQPDYPDTIDWPIAPDATAEA